MGRAKAPRKVYRYSAEFKVKAVKIMPCEEGPAPHPSCSLTPALGG